ncbi:hypothetical protein K438DRAFT_1446849, partial [Mycena galopus ATCC 62051]
YMRATDPFKEERVRAVLEAVEIGNDLTEDEHAKVDALIREFADVFALSVHEVRIIDGPGYAPTVPEGLTFPTGVVPQRPWTQPQDVEVDRQVDELIAAGVLQRIDPHNVKCVSLITLAEK